MPTHYEPRRWRRRPAHVAVLAILGLLSGLLGGVGSTAVAPTPSAAATPRTDFNFADPDTYASGNRYVTVGTSVWNTAPCGGPGNNNYWVPYAVTGLNETVSLGGACAAGDLMPSGPGPWARSDRDIWAPSIITWNGVHHLFYTAKKAGTEQACLGRAVSSTSSIRGPYVWQTEVACPPGGRWALDPDLYEYNGNLYLTYRDDAITSGAETGISAVQLDNSGDPIWSTRRDLLKSTDITWEPGSTATNVIENPSMFRVGNGRFYLFFSGNDWNSVRYSTGVANCGLSPLGPGSTRCQIMDSTARPYFGYVGSGDLNPFKDLPDNRPGPGAMSLFRTHGGAAKVTWHFYSLGSRWSMAGVLSYTSATNQFDIT